MRDYSNMPTMEWAGRTTALHAKAQILREEPVILQMPQGFDLHLENPEACGCEAEPDSGILANCDPNALKEFAGRNGAPELEMVVDAAVESSSRIDLDPKDYRIIVHD